MSYEDKKVELLNKKKKLLKMYQSLYEESMEFAVDLFHITDDENINPSQVLDFVKFIAGDKDIDKLIRLIATLKYVENPEDKDAVFDLRENINIYTKKH